MEECKQNDIPTISYEKSELEDELKLMSEL